MYILICKLLQIKCTHFMNKSVVIVIVIVIVIANGNFYRTNVLSRLMKYGSKLVNQKKKHWETILNCIIM